MRTLDEIISAVRGGEEYTQEELVAAVVAFDVMLAGMNLSENVEALQCWMTAAVSDPVVYAGPNNDPADPDNVRWYRAMKRVGALPFECADPQCPYPNDVNFLHDGCVPF